MTLANSLGMPSEGYTTGIVALMEWGATVALLRARWHPAQQRGGMTVAELVVDTLRGRGIILLSGGMAIGMLTGAHRWSQIAPFYDELFCGKSMLFRLGLPPYQSVRARAWQLVSR